MEPDSSSSRLAVLNFRFRLRDRRMLNTEAASVEAMTEPMSRLSSQESRSTRWMNKPVSPAVSSTPRVESSTDCTATGRAAFQLVPKPP